MTHDPLCPYETDRLGIVEWCYCGLIAKARTDTAARISDAISDTFGRDERALDCADLAAQMFPVQVQP